MNDRDVVVRDSGSGSVATFAIVAVIVVAALIGLFVWQPWNTTTTSKTTIAPSTTSGTTTGGTTTGGAPASSTTTTTTH